MPMYDYKCNSCGNKFDKLVSFSASDKDMECPKCNKNVSEKLLCAPNISNGASKSNMQSGCNAPSSFS